MSRKIFRDIDGNHIIGGTLTGWMFTDSARQMTCPKCYADPGYYCVTPSGHKAWPPHTERIKALTDKFGMAPFSKGT